MMKNSLRKRKNKSFQKGMTLIEVTIAGAMMALLGLASMKLAENNAKTQKKMNFNSQLSNLKMQSNISLRQGDSCLKTLSGNAATTDTFSYPLNGGVANPSPEACQTSGTAVGQLFDRNGNAFIQVGRIYGQNSGASYRVTDARVLLPESLPGDAYACIQVELQGSMVFGQRTRWITEIFQLNGSDVTGQNVVDNCSAESVANVEDSCKALNGELNPMTLTCEGIDIAYEGATITKGDTTFNDVNSRAFSNKRISDAAINALGNMGVAENLHVCGSLSIGDSASNIFPVNPDMSGCGVGSIYAGEIIADNIAGTNLVAENLNVTNSLSTAGNITGSNLNAAINLTVGGDASIGGATQITGILKTNAGIDNQGKNINTGSVTIDGKTIRSSGDTLFVQSKLRAYDHSGVTAGYDYLVTHGWVYKNLLAKMSDEDINKFLHALFETISDDTTWSGDNTVETIKEYTRAKLTLNNMDTSPNKTANISGNSIASKTTDNGNTMVAGTDYCPAGSSVVHVEVTPEGGGEKGTLPGVLNYYCRSNAETAEGQDKIFARIIGDKLHMFEYASTNDIFDCSGNLKDNAAARPEKITPIGGYCFKRVIVCKNEADGGGAEYYVPNGVLDTGETSDPLALHNKFYYTVGDSEKGSPPPPSTSGKPPVSIYKTGWASASDDGVRVLNTASNDLGTFWNIDGGRYQKYAFIAQTNISKGGGNYKVYQKTLAIMRLLTGALIYLKSSSDVYYKAAKSNGDWMYSNADYMLNYNALPRCGDVPLTAQNDRDESNSFDQNNILDSLINSIFPKTYATSAIIVGAAPINLVEEIHAPVVIYQRLK